MTITPAQIDELENFFKSIQLPPSIQLDSGVVVTDIPRFVQSHLAVLRQGFNKPVYEAYFFRLLLLQELLSKQ